MSGPPERKSRPGGGGSASEVTQRGDEPASIAIVPQQSEYRRCVAVLDALAAAYALLERNDPPPTVSECTAARAALFDVDAQWIRDASGDAIGEDRIARECLNRLADARRSAERRTMRARSTFRPRAPWRPTDGGQPMPGRAA